MAVDVSVSVIIPTYNRAYCLRRTLDSVLQQTYPVDEILLIDDGSIDNTEQLVKEHYPQVLYFRQKNNGVSAARNLGIQYATGQWLAFLDSDDAWHQNKINQQLQAISEAENYNVCHTNEIWYRNNCRVNAMDKHQKQGGWILQENLQRCLISPSSVLIHRSVFKTIGNFDESLPACEDYDLWLRICSQMPVLYLEEALTMKYGGHEDQLSKRYWGMDRFRIQALQFYSFVFPHCYFRLQKYHAKLDKEKALKDRSYLHQ